MRFIQIWNWYSSRKIKFLWLTSWKFQRETLPPSMLFISATHQGFISFRVSSTQIYHGADCFWWLKSQLKAWEKLRRGKIKDFFFMFLRRKNIFFFGFCLFPKLMTVIKDISSFYSIKKVIKMFRWLGYREILWIFGWFPNLRRFVSLILFETKTLELSFQ